MHYQGVPCNGRAQDLIENCKWLWDRYTYEGCSSEPLEVRIGYHMHAVTHGDTHRLKELQQIAFAVSSAASVS